MKRRNVSKTTMGGYILVESTVAMVVLGIGIFTVHGVMRQALITKGQAEDYTHVRHLAERIKADLDLQPILVEGRRAGRFDPPYQRFTWEYEIRRVGLPGPGEPSRRQPDAGEAPFSYVPEGGYLAHVAVTISWQRARQGFRESFVTLYGPEKLWLPPRL